LKTKEELRTNAKEELRTNAKEIRNEVCPIALSKKINPRP